MLSVIEHLCNLWHLNNLRPFSNVSLTGNYVALAYSSKHRVDVVLKINVADTHKHKALVYFHGNSCVGLLDYDIEYHALLPEHIKPGTMLKSLFSSRNISAVQITAELIKTIHVKTCSAPH